MKKVQTEKKRKTFFELRLFKIVVVLANLRTYPVKNLFSSRKVQMRENLENMFTLIRNR